MHRIFSGDDWLAVLDIRLSFNIFGHPQIRTRSSPEPASCVAASRPGYPVHPVHPCSICSLSPLIRPVAGKREFPKGDRPAFREVARRIPPPHHRDDTPGSAGVPPACCPFGCRSVSLRCCSRPPCRREPHGPGRSRPLEPLPVDPGGGDGRGCARICAGGTPALPGGAHPMTLSRQGRSVRLCVHSWFAFMLPAQRR